MSQKKQNGRGGVTFLGILALIFITLKLTGHIAWSWLWVLSPLWMPFSAAIIFIIVVSCIAGLANNK